VASLSQGRTAAAQCGLFTHKSLPVIFEPPCISSSAQSSETFMVTYGSYFLQGERIREKDTKLVEFCGNQNCD